MKECSIILLTLLSCLSVTKCEVEEVSACHGTQKEECDFFQLQCETGSRIRLLSQEYGYKDYTCEKKRKKCLKPDNNGCCVYNPEDCGEPFTWLHTYNLMQECSAKDQCGPLQAPNNVLNTCGNNASTYIHIQYDCFSDATILKMCDNQELTGTETSIVFDQASQSLSDPSSCICETAVLNGEEMEVDYVDVRMIRAHSEIGSGSLCSSAILRGDTDSDLQLKCNETISEQDNLIANIVGRVNMAGGRQLKIILEHLFTKGPEDSPVMVWLYLRAVSGKLRTRCYRIMPQPIVPTQSRASVVTSAISTAVPHNNTGEIIKRGKDDDSTAIIVGVLIPALVLMAVGVVLFILWRRRQHPMKRKHAAQNSYTASVGNRNSAAVSSLEYDEIGDVQDAPSPSLYDPVYEAAKDSMNDHVNTSQNGKLAIEKQEEIHKKKHHTYQNITTDDLSMDGKKSDSSQKLTKSTFSDFKNKKAQLLSFFRRKQDLAPTTVEKKPSNASTNSYDHLNANSSEVQLQATPPPEDTVNPYAHTCTYIDQTDSEIPSTGKTASTSDETKNSPSSKAKGVKAVEVGDSYIEFQFGTLDEDGLTLHKSKAKDRYMHNTNAKFLKPNRPPPKPSSPKLKKAKVSQDEISKLPTKKQGDEKTDEQTYDYADADGDVQITEPSFINTSPVKDAKSVNTRPKDGAIVYSYADIGSDENQNIDSLSPDLVYEDIDETAGTSIRKGKSAQDLSLELSCESSGGYEIPVKSQSTRPLSVPDKTEEKERTKSAISGLENVVNEAMSPIGLGNIVKELKEIQELPDLSDSKSLPSELKYANLGRQSLNSKQKMEKSETTIVHESASKTQNKGIQNKKQATSLEPNSKEEASTEEPVIKKDVLSLAKKFEQNQLN